MSERVRQGAKAVALASVVGLAAGAVVLGLGGRILMRVIGLARNATPELSLGGTLIVVFSGAWRGALGAVLYPFIRRLLPGAGAAQGVVLGLATLVLSIGVRPDGLQLARALDAVPLSLASFAGLSILYGLAVHFTLEGGKRGVGSSPTAS